MIISMTESPSATVNEHWTQVSAISPTYKETASFGQPPFKQSDPMSFEAANAHAQ